MPWPPAVAGGLGIQPLVGGRMGGRQVHLLGHVLRKALSVTARQQGWGLAAAAQAAGTELLSGRSLKAALDLDWDDPAERAPALTMVLSALEAIETHTAQVTTGAQTTAAVAAHLATAHQVQAQDVTTNVQGTPCWRDGVVRDRRSPVEDGELRHGRKTQSRLCDGYQRHVLSNLDSGLGAGSGADRSQCPGGQRDRGHRGRPGAASGDAG
jgi:hypothetical protein